MDAMVYYCETIKDFRYRPPTAYVDENGELATDYLIKGRKVGTVRLLVRSIIDNDGQVVDSESVTEVNNWILHQAVSDGAKDTTRNSDALLDYFLFLNEIGLSWDEMPFIKNQRPTYRYRIFLRDRVRGKYPEHRLAKSTADVYMR
ncbi:hypothetical protein [Ferrimonas gelatinilytica]|uniref:Uncharacterized protein n=1 Tax=Ferrimonas gelatinilytica TaxID=1255257 RepID=A0ABP9S0Y7_9GAMM